MGLGFSFAATSSTNTCPSSLTFGKFSMIEMLTTVEPTNIWSECSHYKTFGDIDFFSSAMIVVSAIQFLDVTKTESGTSVDREIYWVTYLLGKCLGRCSTFFPSEI